MSNLSLISVEPKMIIKICFTYTVSEFCKSKVKVKWSIAVRRRLAATGTHVPYGITQYYRGHRGDIPAFTPSSCPQQTYMHDCDRAVVGVA